MMSDLNLHNKKGKSLYLVIHQPKISTFLYKMYRTLKHFSLSLFLFCNFEFNLAQLSVCFYFKWEKFGKKILFEYAEYEVKPATILRKLWQFIETFTSICFVNLKYFRVFYMIHGCFRWFQYF